MSFFLVLQFLYDQVLILLLRIGVFYSVIRGLCGSKFMTIESLLYQEVNLTNKIVIFGLSKNHPLELKQIGRPLPSNGRQTSKF